VRFFIGLPAMQLLSATRKRVVIKAFLREEGGTPLYHYITSFFFGGVTEGACATYSKYKLYYFALSFSQLR